MSGRGQGLLLRSTQFLTPPTRLLQRIPELSLLSLMSLENLWFVGDAQTHWEKKLVLQSPVSP